MAENQEAQEELTGDEATELDELLEDWRSDETCPVKTLVKSEKLKFLSVLR